MCKEPRATVNKRQCGVFSKLEASHAILVKAMENVKYLKV